jgi:hypothetical protein
MSSLSDQQSNYGIDCTAVKAWIAQSLKSVGYVLINRRMEITIAGHSRTPFVFTDTRPFVGAHPKSNPVVSVRSLSPES